MILWFWASTKTKNMMKITVNGVSKEIANDSTILDVVEGLELISTNGIAIALNNAVIPKNKWYFKSLEEDDKVTIIKATQGG